MIRFLLLLAILALPAGAQAPDCNLARKMYDNPFGDGKGFMLRRYEWHLAGAVGSAAAGELLYRATPMPRWASYAVGGFAVRTLPHIRGVSMGFYSFNLRDWTFDAFIGAVPLLTLETWTDSSWKVRLLGTSTIIAGYLAGACYASP
jgi:hypothetical protein